MSAGSSMLAITVSLPPQRRHVSIWIANTRLSRCAHVIETCFGTGCSAEASLCRAPRPRPAGVTAARSA